MAGLRSDDSSGLDAQTDLRRYLRGGLGRAIGGVDDAALDDFTQDAMIRVVTKLETFRGDSRFTTWAMAIAVRVAYTSLRRRRWGDRSLDDLGVSVDDVAVRTGTGLDDPAAPTGRRDLLQLLRELIDRDLTPRQRAAILGELAGMPTDVLAEQLDTNPNALHKLTHDARLRLRASLQARGFSRDDVENAVDGRTLA